MHMESPNQVQRHDLLSIRLPVTCIAQCVSVYAEGIYNSLYIYRTYMNEPDRLCIIKPLKSGHPYNKDSLGMSQSVWIIGVPLFNSIISFQMRQFYLLIKLWQGLILLQYMKVVLSKVTASWHRENMQMLKVHTTNKTYYQKLIKGNIDNSNSQS